MGQSLSGIAVQHPIAFQGEHFVDRYGAKVAEQTPPIAKMLAMDLPVGTKADATWVADFNPWISRSWMVSGRTVGGLALYPETKLPRPRHGAPALHPRLGLDVGRGHTR